MCLNFKINLRKSMLVDVHFFFFFFFLNETNKIMFLTFNTFFNGSFLRHGRFNVQCSNDDSALLAGKISDFFIKTFELIISDMSQQDFSLSRNLTQFSCAVFRREC